MANRQRKKRKLGPQRAREQLARGPANRVRPAMRALVIVYLFIAGSYATAIPAGKGPDETAHVRYLEFVGREHRLPVFDRQHPDPDYEFHQPPLYYLLALPTFLLAGNEQSAQQAVRFFALLLSLPLVYLTFALARRLAPDDPWAAVCAAAVVAFLPAQLSVATTIGNDGLTEVLAAISLLLLASHVRCAQEQERARGLPTMLAVGLVIGLGMLTKSSAILLFPVAWLGAAFAARTEQWFDWRAFLRHTAAATGVALAICGWWLARNQVLYGDPLAQRAFLDAFRGLRPSPQSFMQQYDLPSVGAYVTEVVIWTLASVTGVFGPVFGNLFAFLPYRVYLATGLLALSGAVGFVRYLARGKLARWQCRCWWLFGFFALLLLASFVQFNLSFFQAQARYLFPVLPAAALAFSLGLGALFPTGWRQYILVGVAILLAVFAFASLHLWIAPQFQVR